MREALGHYRILEKIGAGTMGELYRARDTRVGRTVAVRVVAPAIADDPSELQALLQAARASSEVSHPNVATLYEVGVDAGTHYLACEFVSGQSLTSLVAGHPLNPRRAVDLATQIADALADADTRDVAHGDLCPESILVNAKGNAKLLDIGMSRWSKAGADTSAANGLDREAVHERDVRALGGILREMLTGGSSPRADVGAALSRAPQDLARLVDKAEGKSDQERYHAAATLAADLRAVAAMLDARSTAAGVAAPTSVRTAQGGHARGRTALIWLLSLAVLAALAAVVWMAERVR